MQNKYALVLNSFVYAPHRVPYVSNSLNSLVRTHVEGMNDPILQFTFKKSDYDYDKHLQLLGTKFWIQLNEETDFGSEGIDPTFICSVNNVLLMYPEVTHITYLTDDMLYNPEWLHQLDNLIHRHPEAKAWTVYRSMHTKHHRIVHQDLFT